MVSTTNSSKENWNPSQFSQSSDTLFRRIEEKYSNAHLLQLMELLSDIHPDYGMLSRMGSRVAGGDDPINPFEDIIAFLNPHQSYIDWNTRTAAEWASEAQTIFNIPDKPGFITGRMVLAAAILSEFDAIRPQITEPEEWHQKCNTLIDKISEELLHFDKIALEEWYSDRGKTLIHSLTSNSFQNIEDSDHDHSSIVRTPNISDNPAKEDKLSRYALAEHIAKRIRFIYDRDVEREKAGSFFVHIDGPWGSGKSTLLHFMERIVTAEEVNAQSKGKAYSDWVVVNFNAWEHQRLSPPWWYLLNSVYKAILAHTLNKKKNQVKALLLWISEGWWRLNTGTNFLWATVLTLALFIASLYLGIFTEENAKELPIYQTGSLIAFLWSLSKLLRTSLISGSSRAAQEFVQEYGKDPMEKIARHFKKMVGQSKHPVAIFIEDLDRCNRDYGILLMEGLQTIFKQAPIVFVIAADAKWLRTMYESQYNIFEKVIAGPGKPFGLIFLDKVFQMRIELPDISAEQKRAYWNSLLSGRKVIKKDEQETEIEDKTLQQVRDAKSIEEQFRILDKVEEEHDLHQKVREEMLKSISIQEEQTSIEHVLAQFVDLIEPNPRAMKRLVNDVSMAKAISILYNQKVDQEQLVLWSILKQKHPAFASWLWNEPEAFSKLPSRQTDITEFDTILSKPSAKNLFEFKSASGNITKIDADFIACMKFQK